VDEPVEPEVTSELNDLSELDGLSIPETVEEPVFAQPEIRHEFSEPTSEVGFVGDDDGFYEEPDFGTNVNDVEENYDVNEITPDYDEPQFDEYNESYSDEAYDDDSFDNENALIEALDNYVSAKEFDSIVETNEYRNKVLIILNEDLTGTLIDLPDTYKQFEILLHQFFNKKINNPIQYLGHQIAEDLNKDENDRERTDDEWESLLEFSKRLAVFWDSESELTVDKIYANIFEYYPRTDILKHLNYGLNPQHLKDLEESLANTLEKSAHIEDAEDSLLDKFDIQQIYQLKYFEPEVYAEMLDDELEFLQTGAEPVKIGTITIEGQEVVD